MESKVPDSIEKRLANLTPAQRELLAEKMKQQKNDKPSNILVIKEGDNTKRRPLFCMHPPLGVTGYYLNIANHLPDDQSVYGIQCPALSSPVSAHDDMTEMARDYFDQIRSIQSEPPYQIIGHSSGAFIAYEISKLIENHEENQPFLFCIDQHAPIGDKEPLVEAYSGDDLEDNIQTVYLTCWLVSMAHNCELTFTAEQLGQCDSRESRNKLVSSFLKESGFLPQSADLSTVSLVLHMIANHFSADSKYIDGHNLNLPSEKYDGKLIIFRSTEETSWVGLGFVTEADSSLASGWEDFCSKPIKVIDIPNSDHINLLMDPAVKTLSDELEKYLYKAE